MIQKDIKAQWNPYKEKDEETGKEIKKFRDSKTEKFPYFEEIEYTSQTKCLEDLVEIVKTSKIYSPEESVTARIVKTFNRGYNIDCQVYMKPSVGQKTVKTHAVAQRLIESDMPESQKRRLIKDLLNYSQDMIDALFAK